MDKRVRSWATVLYPESAKEKWIDILGEQCVPCFVSPLHNCDCNADGELKKEHYHILFVFDGKKSKDQVQEICDLIGSVGLETVNSTRAYARYLCHLDNPEKHQYNVDDVISFGGADYISLIGTSSDKYLAVKQMMSFCKSSGVISYAELLEYASEHEIGWFRALCDNATVVMKEYLKSVSWTIEKDKKNLSV